MKSKLLELTTVTLLLCALCADLRAATAPTITQQPADTFGFTSNRFSLTVTTSGTGPLRYQWFRNEAAVETATNRTFSVRTALTVSSSMRVKAKLAERHRSDSLE